ncbi:hypothetical protein PUR71_32770 [Streptomyces sp. SP17BM10]|nr:hypothetical protein [Streptomyces sp. SP17BM10]MEE1787646.1 hypothetical protein [Streptomyces sp. SP17BM10]
MIAYVPCPVSSCAAIRSGSGSGSDSGTNDTGWNAVPGAAG